MNSATQKLEQTLIQENETEQQKLIDQFLAVKTVEKNKEIQNIKMGFEKQDISSALFASDGNAERTLELLIEFNN